MNLYPGSYIHNRQDEVISPSQTTLLKLLDSFLQSIPPASFLGEGDHLRDLAGFLAAAFLFQAENGCRAIQLVTGTPLPEPKATAKANDGSILWSSSGAADLQLSAVCVALVLLSTSLSTILLSERENEGGTSADPVLVSMTLPCADAISGSQSPTGTGFIESLLGLVVPFVRCLSIIIVTYCGRFRNSARVRRLFATHQFWEGQAATPEWWCRGSCTVRGRSRF